MRIIAGQWKGRGLPKPVDGTRPTPDRAREALFSILYSRGLIFQQSSWIDLFCGTGSVGLEALSRGAGFVAFADGNHRALASLGRYLDRIGARERARLVELKVPEQLGLLRTLADRAPFDVIFADPPFTGDIRPGLLLEEPAMAELVGPGTTVIWEREATPADPVDVPGWQLDDRRRYGRVEFLIYERER